MSTNDTKAVSQQLHDAKESLKKLPILGPAMWLYARDDRKKYTFIAEQDWLLTPPIVLDQCKLYTRDEIPWAFCTWAFVSDEIDARLRSGMPRIAPHEWKSGAHPWIIDIVTPFGDRDGIIDEVRRNVFGGAAISALLGRSDGSVVVTDYPALNTTATAPQAKQ